MSDVAHLLRTQNSSLPKVPRKEEFADTLRSSFARYLESVRALSASDYASVTIREAEPEIEQLGASLLGVLDKVSHGQAAQARLELDRALAAMAVQLAELTSASVGASQLGVLYRARKNASNARLSRGDIFHLPFELRHLASPQRFSVLGLPTLYLGSSLYLCWEELQRPNVDELWISAIRLRPERTLRVLDFGYHPGVMAELIERAGFPQTDTHIARLVSAYGIVWPLIAACTYQVKEKHAPFKVEYVISQLLMSWIAENPSYTGIRYFSTHVLRPPAAAPLCINYALPARDISASGYCSHLADTLELTEPLSWMYANTTGTATSYMYHGRRFGVLMLGEDHFVPYEGTQFAIQEVRLDLLAYGRL
jgi:hypothetical protein